MPDAERLTGNRSSPDRPCRNDGVTMAPCELCGGRLLTGESLVTFRGPADAPESVQVHARCARERSLFDSAFRSSGG
jgi:hypothetical protein